MIVPDGGYSNLLTMIVPDEGYSYLLTMIVPDGSYSNLLTMIVPDEGTFIRYNQSKDWNNLHQVQSVKRLE
jgi:hypothetical protein